MPDRVPDTREDRRCVVPESVLRELDRLLTLKAVAQARVELDALLSKARTRDELAEQVRRALSFEDGTVEPWAEHHYRAEANAVVDAVVGEA